MKRRLGGVSYFLRRLSMKRNPALLLLFSLLVMCRTATVPTVLTVLVQESRCGYPIPGALVVARSAAAVEHFTTNGRGEGRLLLPPGTWRISVAVTGAVGSAQDVLLEGGLEQVVRLTLDFSQPDSMRIEPHGPCRPQTSAPPNSPRNGRSVRPSSLGYK